ncbi:hypothetical protein JCM16303_005006 [Sporobolomyces ruberrimus]
MSTTTPLSQPRKRAQSATKALLDQDSDSSIQSLASLLIRSLLVLFLVLTSLSLALIAWFSLRSFLKVDPIIGRERVWLQYGEFRTPYGIIELPKGRYEAPGENYDVSLELKVPSSQQNLLIGNFMVSINLLNEENSSILNNSRPSILTHPTYPRFSHLLPHLRPIPPPTQSIEIPLLESVGLNRNSWTVDRKRVERILVEVGRKDAHSDPINGASLNQVGSYVGGGGKAVVPNGGGELQVYESYLKIHVRLYGLRALIRSHPYISFLFFFPTFLLTELIAAFIVYAYFVLRPTNEDLSTLEKESDEVRIKEEEEEEEEEEEDVVGKELEKEIKGESTEENEEEEVTSEPPSGLAETTTTEEEEEEEEEIEGEERWREERRRERREREAGPGGKGMSEIAGETETETETEPGISEEEEEEVGEGGSAEGSEEWAAIEGEVEGEEKDFDENATIGGSETTRATRSSFGSSLAGTTSTRTTATSTRTTEGLRERQGRLDER